jgi:hypothetical protein
MNDLNEKTLSWKYLLTETYRTYWEHFGTFSRIALAPALLVYLLDYIPQALVPWLQSLPFDKASWYISVIWTAKSAAYFVVSGLFFAAVASQLVAVQDYGARPLSDAYTRTRGRLGTIVAISLLVWTIFFIGRRVSVFGVYSLLFYRLRAARTLPALRLTSFIISLILAGILSRLGLAIPEAMKDQSISFAQSLRNSIRKTENWELFSMAFLAKSAIVAYGAYWLYGEVIHRLWRQAMLNPALTPWIDRVVYIALAAALESPLFIAFSILCRDWKPAPEEAYTPPPIG